MDGGVLRGCPRTVELHRIGGTLCFLRTFRKNQLFFHFLEGDAKVGGTTSVWAELTRTTGPLEIKLLFIFLSKIP